MMHSANKYFASLAAIAVSCMGLLFITSNSVFPQDAKKANLNIKELQQKRLAVLEQIRDVAQKMFQNARTTFETIHDAERELLAARLAYAETENDQIKACDDAIEHALQWQQIAKAMRAAAQVSAVAELKAEAFVLETQITRETFKKD